MRRRTLLAGVATGVSGGLAGCFSAESPAASPDENPTDTTDVDDKPTDQPPTGDGSSADPETVWTRSLAGTADTPLSTGATLAAADGSGPARDRWLFVPTDAGVCHALDPATGEERWRAEPSEPVRDVAVAAAPGFAIVHAGRPDIGAPHLVQAVDASGDVQWSFPASAGDERTGHLELLGADDGRVFVATRDDALSDSGETLFALDAATGEPTWTGEVGDPRSAAITDDAVYVASYGAVDAFARPGGEHRWRFAPEGADYQFDTLRADTERAYLATTDARNPAKGTFHALEATTGDHAWRRDGFVTSVTFADRLYLGSDGVVAVDPATGEAAWTGDAEAFLSGGPVHGDSLYAGGDGISAYDTTDGSERWTWSAPADIVTTAAAGDAAVYAGTGGGDEAPPVVYARNAADGSERWTFEADARPTDPVLDDLVYVAAGGTAYALKP